MIGSAMHEVVILRMIRGARSSLGMTPAPFGFRFLKLNHKDLARRLTEIRHWSAQMPPRLAVAYQFLIGHLAEPGSISFEIDFISCELG
jgi:hypothetical protein